MELVLWPCLGRKANSQAYPTAEYSTQSYPTRKYDQRIQVTQAYSTVALGQETKSLVLTNCSQPMAPPVPTSHLRQRQWSHPNRDPERKPHLPKDATSWPIQNPKLRWTVKDNLCWSKPVKSEIRDPLLKCADTNTRNQVNMTPHRKLIKLQ